MEVNTMKSFFYIVHQKGRDCNGNPKNTMNIYQLVKKDLVDATDHHTRYRNPKGQRVRLTDSLWALKEQGILSIQELV